MCVCHEVLPSFTVLLLISLLGCSLISMMYWDSKISFCQHVSLWTWGVAGDTVEEVGLTGRKMNAVEYVWIL